MQMLNKTLLIYLGALSLSPVPPNGHHQSTIPLLLCDPRVKLKWSFDYPQSLPARLFTLKKPGLL